MYIDLDGHKYSFTYIFFNVHMHTYANIFENRRNMHVPLHTYLKL